MSKYSDDFRIEIKKGFLDAVGSMADYRIRLDAGGWVDKNVLTEEDYLEICRAVEAQYIVPEPPVEEPIEDIPTEETEDETILDGEEGTETETEENETETEIPEDSTNDGDLPETESTEQTTEDPVEETPETEPTEPTE